MNNNFTFNECSADCRCSSNVNIDECLNRMVASTKKYQWKMIIKRV